MQPNPDSEWWNTSDVAAYLGVKVGTVSAYRLRGQMPAADLTVGRTHLWRPSRILEWHGARPRLGIGGRPIVEPGAEAERSGAGEVAAAGSAWQVHGRRWLYESKWVRLGLADVELPDGQRFEHHVVWMPSAAMTALLDDSGKRVLLMWRHRFVPDVWNWELPGGLVEDDEDPAVTAAREVEEETGYRPRRLEHAVTFEPMIGMVNSPHHVFIGHGAEKFGEPSEANEMERMEWVPLTEVPRLIADGLVRNSGSLVALLHVLAISGRRGPRRSTATG
jgi:8-oxo-dGTP pyrophosphatase MutT (NUDIX family)